MVEDNKWSRRGLTDLYIVLQPDHQKNAQFLL